ncbi:AMP-binding protein [Micromonospora sp. B11E3]|uniref:AMP-binding protein n=1 Tax=Micromonospora sp. B11E3 TaxID=3153562 RepID=UPI00325D06D2
MTEHRNNTISPAIANGGPPPALTVPTLGEALVRAARLPGSGHLTYIAEDGSESRQTYGELLQDASLILAGIRGREDGPAPGDRVLVQIDHAPSLLAAFWACVLGGFVPVPVSADPPPAAGMSAAELLAGVWGVLGRRAWVVTGDGPGATTPVDATGSRAWAERLLGSVTELRRCAPTPERQADFHRADPDDVAVLLLTSGSTGLPKAVRLTHRNILSRAVAATDVRGLTTANRSFNWMPLDHVGGLAMFHVRDVLLGCHQVHANHRWVIADPLRWLAAMSRHRSHSTWAPNFAFGLINDRAQDLAGQSWDLSQLGYIMNGGEAVKARIARRFLALLAPFGLPGTAIHPGWGMSETSAGVVESVFDPESSSDEDRFVSLGRPHPGVELRVVDERGAILPEGTVGRLQVRGAAITAGYDNNPEQNRQTFTDDGWFKSGDLAFIRDGELTVTGRADDIIEVGGVSYHSHEIEAVVEEMTFVEPSYTVVCPDGAADSAGLLIFLHLRPGTDHELAEREVGRHVSDRFGTRHVRVIHVDRDEVPKTGIGKLKRAQLLQRYEP